MEGNKAMLSLGLAVGLTVALAAGVQGWAQQPLPLPGGDASQPLPPPNPLIPDPNFGNPAPGNPAPGAPDFEVQARGPLHEAFAQPNDAKIEPGPPIAQQPPPPVPEQPPEERPEGDNVHWLNGYWAYNAENNQFEWVTGVYRQFPPGRRFVPGYWTETDAGWRWVPGFWAPDGQQEIPYVPEPPAPLESTPTGQAPDNSIYVSGYWRYNNNQYAWRPGYWVACQPGWIWVPARYIWTPYGFVYCSGYWDYPLANRGLLFAPVVFNRPLWLTAGWYYRPSYCILNNLLYTSLFYRPSYGCYYFGDYYGTAYYNRGFRPWSSFRYDPLFGYYNWYNGRYRNNRNWGVQINQVFVDRGAGRLPRPPRTFAQQQTLVARGARGAPLALASFDSVRTNGKFVRLNNTQLQAQRTFIQNSRSLETARRNFERQARIAGNGGTPGGGKGPGGPGAGKGPRGLNPSATFKLPANAFPPTVRRGSTGGNSGGNSGGTISGKGPIRTNPSTGTNVPRITLPGNSGAKKSNPGNTPKNFNPGNTPRKQTGPVNSPKNTGGTVTPPRKGSGSGGAPKNFNPGNQPRKGGGSGGTPNKGPGRQTGNSPVVVPGIARQQGSAPYVISPPQQQNFGGQGTRQGFGSNNGGNNYYFPGNNGTRIAPLPTTPRLPSTPNIGGPSFRLPTAPSLPGSTFTPRTTFPNFNSQPRVQPRSTPSFQPRSTPRSTPSFQPRSQPRAAPRSTPSFQPRSQPRSAPRVSAPSAPRMSAPRSSPRPSGFSGGGQRGGGGKGGGRRK